VRHVADDGDDGAGSAGPGIATGMTAVFRRTLTRVIIAQVAALLLLWFLQARYTA
jgi:hypothetical protein